MTDVCMGGMVWHAPGTSHVLIFWSTYSFVHDFFLILQNTRIGAEETEYIVSAQMKF